MHRHPLSILVDILVALLTAAIAVSVILPFSVVAPAVCFAVVKSTTESRRRDGQTRLAACGAIAAALVFVGVVAAAAAYRPAKVVERQLSRPVTLPETRMTLAQLAYHHRFYRRDIPAVMEIAFADEGRDIVVEWPARQITLRQFLKALESQTELRHKFSHCGNGYTILGGGDCSFGLMIFDPELKRDQDRFDVDAYALLRDAAESSPRGTP